MNRTQGARLASVLKRRAHTYLEMQELCISTSPQKRVAEWLYHNEGWMLHKGKRDGLVTWAIVRSERRV